MESTYVCVGGWGDREGDGEREIERERKKERERERERERKKAFFRVWPTFFLIIFISRVEPETSSSPFNLPSRPGLPDRIFSDQKSQFG
jgi:hypothetical protein